MKLDKIENDYDDKLTYRQYEQTLKENKDVGMMTQALCEINKQDPRQTYVANKEITKPLL